MLVAPDFHHGFASTLRDAIVVISLLKLRKVLIAVAVIGRQPNTVLDYSDRLPTNIQNDIILCAFQRFHAVCCCEAE